MSGFADSCRAQSAGAWRLAASWPERYGAWKRGTGIGGRAQRGCVGFLFFGIAYIFLPLMVFLAVEVVLVAYAVLASLLWVVGAIVDGVKLNAKPPQP